MDNREVNVLLEFAFPVFLGALLLCSGISKIFTVRETASAIDAFQVPRWIPRHLTSIVLPYVEILLGIGFVSAGGQLLRAVALLAGFILGVFTFYLIRIVRQRRSVTCNCFGSLRKVPVGMGTIGRNIGLIIIAGSIAIFAPRTAGAIAFTSQFDQRDFAWLSVLVFSHGAAYIAFRQRKKPGVSVEEPVPTANGITRSVGSDPQASPVIPRGELRTYDGGVVTLAELPARRAQILVFAQYGCQDCSLLLAELPAWAQKLSPAVDIRIVTSAPRNEFDRHYPALAPATLYDGSFMVGSLLGVHGVPSAILLGTNGRIGAGPATGLDESNSLLESVYQVIFDDPISAKVKS